ncbi:hypothetical protein [Actinoplanes regularis]|uniref:Uncharacterized protein n=1 Tax=Actinoplanes regularis TaxID=52697 RepID=A0A239J153_9ACTN|nr:hypothetical protein [Actinoplanes regularis]GIE91915.1 hypothetical protein Are01nite_83950 [Actinoplanes regularis]SNS99641.1 hypothetical protein SAMN06264365_13222 [Actinoplanes regularis]
MTSFPAYARQVRDESLDPVQRRMRLRNCLYRFAPYGFNATWHHLAITHRIPGRIAADPSSLVRALDELEAARAPVLARSVAFAAERRLQKREGRRVPQTPHPWDSWGCHNLAYCPDPRKHPAEPLPLVVGRVLEAYTRRAGPDGGCLVCGEEDWTLWRVCQNCGVASGGRGSIL